MAFILFWSYQKWLLCVFGHIIPAKFHVFYVSSTYLRAVSCSHAHEAGFHVFMNWLQSFLCSWLTWLKLKGWITMPQKTRLSPIKLRDVTRAGVLQWHLNKGSRTFRLNIHSTFRLNIHSTFRLNIHSIFSLNIHSTFRLNIHSTVRLNIHSTVRLNIQSTFRLNIHSTFRLNIHSMFRLNIHSTFRLNIQSTFRLNIQSTFRLNSAFTLQSLVL